MELDDEWENFLNGAAAPTTTAKQIDIGEAPECDDLYISTKTKLLYLNQK